MVMCGDFPRITFTSWASITRLAYVDFDRMMSLYNNEQNAKPGMLK